MKKDNDDMIPEGPEPGNPLPDQGKKRLSKSMTNVTGPFGYICPITKQTAGIVKMESRVVMKIIPVLYSESE